MTDYKQSADVQRKIGDIRAGMDGGDRRWLANDIDVCMWIEPIDKCYEIDAEGSASVYYAAVNFGYFDAVVRHGMRCEKGAVELLGYQSGEMQLRVGTSLEIGYVNWDHCGIRSISVASRDDVSCEWVTQLPDSQYRVVTLVRVETKKT